MLDQADPLDRVFQALADPSRRLMVERLSRGPASVSELARPFSMSLAAVVQHVQVLEACGLVRSEKVGRVRTCQIAPATLRTAERWIAERRSTWERRLDALGHYLAEHPDPAEHAERPDPAEPAGPVEPAGPAEPGPVRPAEPGPTRPDQAHPDQGSIR
jgi:DNA-binding transcriptional ArsR family regulator